ncbi:MAG: GNAT family N-acetyltransferase, partial [Butyricicoccus sp.]|nr:GNAT family N-acetyltransferase [Butyricicoccus sp.]
MDIRDVTAEDIGRILEIERECFSLPWTERQLAMQLEPGHVFLAACADGEPIGYVGLGYVLDEGYISNVAVAPEHRRRGAAGALLAGPLLTLMGTPQDVLPLSVLYMKIFFVGMPATLVYNFGSAILRAVGDTKRPLYFLMLAGIINVALNLFFVISLHMGVAGVA